MDASFITEMTQSNALVFLLFFEGGGGDEYYCTDELFTTGSVTLSMSLSSYCRCDVHGFHEEIQLTLPTSNLHF